MIFPFMIKVSKETPLIHKSPKMALANHFSSLHDAGLCSEQHNCLITATLKKTQKVSVPAGGGGSLMTDRIKQKRNEFMNKLFLKVKATFGPLKRDQRV